MAEFELLDDSLDRRHRASVIARGQRLNTLKLRNPSHLWRVDPAWVDRFVYFVMLLNM